jgi:hypothetical protein
MMTIEPREIRTRKKEVSFSKLSDWDDKYLLISI